MSCSKQIEERHLVKQEFSYPVFINTYDTISLDVVRQNRNSLLMSFPSFEGVYSFNEDTIDLNYRKIIEDLNKWEQVEGNYIQYYDSLSTNGFELVADYSTSIPKKGFIYESIRFDYYPVYIINYSNKPKLLKGKDLHLFGLQEAVQKSSKYYERWHPVEMRGWDFCGNGHWSRIIMPNQYAVVLFPKYTGDFKTKMRVRIQNGESIYVSQPFDGVVNKSQFYFKDSTALKDLTQDCHSMDGYHWFYGANPILELEPKEQFRNH